jgi:hypothetical protein
MQESVILKLTRVGDWEISTADIPNHGLETCVFNNTTRHNGETLGIPVERHSEYTEAMIYHMAMVLHLTEHPVSLHKFGTWPNLYV